MGSNYRFPGVQIIPEWTFRYCDNIRTVIMADTVKRIGKCAFYYCKSLEFVRLSKNIEYIGAAAFSFCYSLTSIFVPESCRDIGREAFYCCDELIILSFGPRHTELGDYLINCTALIKASPFETDEYGHYKCDISNGVNEWIQNLNQTEEFALHRECASIEPPSENNIYEIIKQQGLPSLHVKNEIGVTPLEYLEKNSYSENHIDQHKLMKRLVLDLMGEIIA